ncbi:MAG: hypothetical protein PVJ34_10735, partial [Anaerolineae bacterium]
MPNEAQYPIPNPSAPMDPYPLVAPLALATGTERREYRARLVRAGTIRAQGNRPSNLQIPAATLQRAGTEHKFDSKPTFIDHPTWIEEYPSLR